MRRYLIAAAPLLALAACGGGGGEAAGEAEESAAAVPDEFPLGEYEVTSTVASVSSTDQTTPATTLKEGDTRSRKACVTDAKDLRALFVDSVEGCKTQADYARRGRINTAYSCRKAGSSDLVNPTVNGNYTADGFEAVIDSSTLFAGTGDYLMKENVTGTRLGDCAADGAAESAG